MNVAFELLGGKEWTGGTAYMDNLFSALRKYCSNEIKIYLVAPKKDYRVDKRIRELVHKIIITDILSKHSIKWIRRKIEYTLFNKETIYEKLLLEKRIDCIFARRIFGKNFGIPIVAWIPDFQYLHLPEMFSKREIERRRKFHKRIVENSDIIVLSSNDAKKDFNFMYPEKINKVRVASFIARVPANIFSQDLNNILKKYEIPKKFFYLPNQFWKHKNHITVFRAVRILRQRNIHVNVVCTGRENDQRNPHYYGHLLSFVKHNNLNQNIYFLGLIPHDEVYSLMHQSICVINPSLFEGWSTTVEECKSLGKNMILSNIGVHREQAPPLSKYFEPLDYEDLADTMERLWSNPSSVCHVGLWQKTKNDYNQRQRAYALTYLRIFREAILNRKNRHKV